MYNRREKLALIASMVGETTNNLATVYEMPADGLSIGEAFQVLKSTQRIQEAADRTQKWLQSLSEVVQ